MILSLYGMLQVYMWLYVCTCTHGMIHVYVWSYKITRDFTCAHGILLVYMECFMCKWESSCAHEILHVHMGFRMCAWDSARVHGILHVYMGCNVCKRNAKTLVWNAELISEWIMYGNVELSYTDWPVITQRIGSTSTPVVNMHWPTDILCVGGMMYVYPLCVH